MCMVHCSACPMTHLEPLGVLHAAERREAVGVVVLVVAVHAAAAHELGLVEAEPLGQGGLRRALDGLAQTGDGGQDLGHRAAGRGNEAGRSDHRGWWQGQARVSHHSLCERPLPTCCARYHSMSSLRLPSVHLATSSGW